MRLCHTTLFLPAACFAVILSTPTGVAQEWTRFRGPGGQGVGQASDLPATFADANVRWRVAVGGTGHSSPVLWGDKLLLTRTVDAGGRELACFAADTGKELWAAKNKVEGHRHHKFNDYSSATPTVDATGIYVAWTSGEEIIAQAWNHAGEELWTRPLGGFISAHGSGSSPIVFEDQVVIANENDGDDCFLVGLDKKTGKSLWRIKRDKKRNRASYACPMVYRPKSGDPYLLFTSSVHGLTAVDPAKGEILWEINPDITQRCVNCPTIWEDVVFFSAGSGGGGKESAMLRLNAKRDQPPERLESPRRSLPYVPCALAIDGRLYLFSDGGVASCMEVAGGKQLWRERLDGSFFGSPVTNGKVIYITDKSGVLFSLAAGKEFKLLGTFDLGDLSYGTPAIARGLMYARTNSQLWCLGPPKDGAVAASDDAPPEIRHSYKIEFTKRRIALTKKYAELHYSEYYKATTGTAKMPGLEIDPKVIVVHYTAGRTLQSAFKTFEPETLGGRPYLNKAGAVNVGIQFIVDRDGTIYQAMPDNYFGRHCIGLNHCAIGFENIGMGDITAAALSGQPQKDRRVTLAQLQANAKLIRHLKKKYPGLEILIGHMEYQDLEDPKHPGHKFFQENDPNYRTRKSDPGPRFMAGLRRELADILKPGSRGIVFR